MLLKNFPCYLLLILWHVTAILKRVICPPNAHLLTKPATIKLHHQKYIREVTRYLRVTTFQRKLLKNVRELSIRCYIRHDILSPRTRFNNWLVFKVLHLVVVYAESL